MAEDIASWISARRAVLAARPASEVCRRVSSSSVWALNLVAGNAHGLNRLGGIGELHVQLGSHCFYVRNLDTHTCNGLVGREPQPPEFQLDAVLEGSPELLGLEPLITRRSIPALVASLFCTRLSTAASNSAKMVGNAIAIAAYRAMRCKPGFSAGKRNVPGYPKLRYHTKRTNTFIAMGQQAPKYRQLKSLRTYI